MTEVGTEIVIGIVVVVGIEIGAGIEIGIGIGNQFLFRKINAVDHINMIFTCALLKMTQFVSAHKITGVVVRF